MLPGLDEQHSRLSAPSERPPAVCWGRKGRKEHEQGRYVAVKDEHAIPVPKHDQIKRVLLLEIIAEAGLTKEEFLELLK